MAPEAPEAIVEAPVAGVAPEEPPLGPQEQPLVDWAMADRRIDDRRRGLLSPAQQRRYDLQIRAGQAVGRDLEDEGFVDAFLTNPEPGAHVAGTAATGLGVDWTMPERYRDGILKRLYRSDQNGLYRTETAGILRATIGAFEDSLRILAAATEDEEDLLEETPGGLQPSTASGYGFDLTTSLGQAVDVLAGTMPPSPAIMDSGVYRGIAYRMDLRRLAYQEAIGEGLKGPALEARVAELEATPSEEMTARTVDAQTLRTVNDELGPQSQIVARWAAEVPGGRLVAPYLRVPASFPQWFGPEATTLAHASIQDARDRAALGRPLEGALARAALGRAVAATIAWNVADGRITGRQATDIEAVRVQPDRPAHTFRIGAEDIPYPAEPGTLGQLVSAIATHAQIEALLPQRPEAYQEWARLIPALTLATGVAMRDPEMLDRFAGLLGAIRDQGMHGSPLAPLVVGAIVTAATAASRTWIGRKVIQEFDGLAQLAWDHAVAAYQQVPAHRDPIEGHPVLVPRGFGGDLLGPIVAEFAAGTETDLVRQQLDINDYVPKKYPWVIAGRAPEGWEPWQEADPREGITLKAGERDLWIQYTTQKVTDRNGRNLKQALEHLMAPDSPYWTEKPGPGGGQVRQIHNVFNTYMQMGQQMMRDPASSRYLEAAVEQVEERRRRDALPITDPESPYYGMSLPEIAKARRGVQPQTRKALRKLIGSLGG